MKYVDSKKKLKEFLKYECKRYGLKRASYPIFAFGEGAILFRFNFLLRKLEYYTNCKKRIRGLLFHLFYLRLERRYLVFIPINVFDKGFKMIHLGPRIVNGKTVVGKNFVMHANTYMVAGGVNDCAPVIGDDCIMGVGSIILGDAIVGDNSAIGAGAVVTRRFSDGNMTIAGVPAKKISDKTRADWSAEKRRTK